MNSANEMHVLLERQRVLVSQALCTVAEADFYTHNSRQAFETLQTIQRLVGEINVLTVVSRRISSGGLSKLAELLSKLETGLKQYEVQLAVLPAISVG
jgi:hypothetical protein